MHFLRRGELCPASVNAEGQFHSPISMKGQDYVALVEEDHGRELALVIARELVMFLRRPGGQLQFSV